MNMMASTSKSNGRKNKKFKYVPKPKQQWKVKQQKRNWLELPSDVMANILHRVGVYFILENAQKVCTSWRQICKDPAMWRVIYMSHSDPCSWPSRQMMCKHAVDRSQGQLVHLIIEDIATHELLGYIVDKYVCEFILIGIMCICDLPFYSFNRSSQLRHLDIINCIGEFYDGWTEVLKKFPLLEELSLCRTEISEEDIEGLGKCCPMLTTLKVNQVFFRCFGEDNDEESLRIRNKIAIAIGKNLPELRQLELIGSTMSNAGLQAIVDGCQHLESLDIRQCLNLDLKGEIVKKCSEKIKCLKLPDHSVEGLPFYLRSDVNSDPEDFISEDFEEYFDYDEYRNPYHFENVNNYKSELFDSDDDIEDLDDMLTFMALFG